ncbi:hypothetical protein [Sphingomonas floccifaciens]|uniref:hypothetical protein n=1 Tax=Sphingomonas floccifaciens TaxID=1844115 RepID=UPI0032EF1FC7
MLRTDVNDEACGLAERKIGPDVDESPGGCGSVTVRLSAAGVTAAPSTLSE